MENDLRLDDTQKEKYISLGMNVENKHFRNHYLSGNLNISNISNDYITDIKDYYKQFTDKEINMKNHIVIKNLTGAEDVRFISREFLRQDIIPYFNDIGMINYYTDKNSYDLLFHEFNQPDTIIKNVRGQFLTNKNKHISFDEAKKTLLNEGSEFIIKSSDVENGESVKKLIIDGENFILDNKAYTFEDIVNLYISNFTIQKIIKQHPVMAKLHPYSVNTLRIVTLRWENEIKHIYTFCRFGVNKDVKDNAGQGGIVVGVKDNGSFMDYGANRYEIVKKHPTTEIPVSELERIPNYEKCINLAKEMHKKVLHHDFVSWDIAIEEKGEPIFIECNFYGSAIVNQIALKRPIFGDLTDDILKKVYSKERTSYNRDANTEYSKLLEKFNNRREKLSNCRARNRRLRKRLEKESNKRKLAIRKKNVEIKKLKVKINELEHEIHKIKNSRSWRYTSFLRRKK